MGLIYTEVLKKNLPEFRNPIREGQEKFNQGYNMAINEIYDLIDDQPTITQWIPVSERLPEDNAKVLISTNWGYVGTIRYEAGSSLWDNDVTAWMPLPEPYKESE